jgi:hypothetical protein
MVHIRDKTALERKSSVWVIRLTILVLSEYDMNCVTTIRQDTILANCVTTMHQDTILVLSEYDMNCVTTIRQDTILANCVTQFAELC